MAVLRIISWVLVALALMVLGYDGISTLKSGIPAISTTAEILGIMGLELNVPEGGIGKLVLDLPMSVLLGLPGVILTLVLRPID